MLIALLEDEESMAALMREWFSRAGYSVMHYPSGQAFRRGVAAQAPELAVIDRVLPDDDGIEVTRWLRRTQGPDLPILFASGLGHEGDIVAALDAGADDYIVKPLRAAELLARIRALTRRFAGRPRGRIACGPVTLDASNRTAFLHGERVPLTDREYEVALYLFTHRGELVSRLDLLRSVWRTTAALQTRTVDQHVSRLRQKLQLRPEAGFRLETVYNHGYRLTHASDPAAAPAVPGTGA